MVILMDNAAILDNLYIIYSMLGCEQLSVCGGGAAVVFRLNLYFITYNETSKTNQIKKRGFSVPQHQVVGAVY